MKGEQAAMQIFELVKAKAQLPTKIEDLVPLSFIGQAAVSFYREKIKLMKALDMAEDQRKATLSDGQDAGEMLLDIEVKIGEIVDKEPQVQAPARRSPDGSFVGKKPSGQPPKHERLGMKEKRMQLAQTIFKNQEVVEQIKRAARENEDIATKTAVLSAVKFKNFKKEHKGIDPTKEYKIPSIDQFATKNVFRPISELKTGLERLAGNCVNLNPLNQELLKNELDNLIVMIQKIRKEI